MYKRDQGRKASTSYSTTRRRPPNKNWKKLRSVYLALRNRPTLLFFSLACLLASVTILYMMGVLFSTPISTTFFQSSDCYDSGDKVFCEAALAMPENCKLFGDQCRKTCGLCNAASTDPNDALKLGPGAPAGGGGAPGVGGVQNPPPVANRVDSGDDDEGSALSRAAPAAPSNLGGRESEDYPASMDPGAGDAGEAAGKEAAPGVDPWNPDLYSFEKGEIGTYRGATVTPELAKQWKGEVETAFKKAWGEYAEHCFGEDELWPSKKRCHNWVGMGLTIIDSMDVLWLMGMKTEFQRCVDWVSTKFNPKPNRSVSFFETVIRVVGGLLSAYDLSKEKILLDKVQQLVDNMMPVFDSPTGLPYGMVNPFNGAHKALGWAGGNSLLAEIGTIQMEYWYLSNHTKNPVYHEKTHRVIDILDFENTKEKSLSGLPLPGQYPNYINPSTLKVKNNQVSWGGLGDSFYEYLLKMWILTGKQNEQYLRMYRASVRGMLENLFKRDGRYSYVAEYRGGPVAKMDHLACFLGALLAMGVRHGAVEGEEAALHMHRAKELAFTCNSMYTNQPSGLSPDHVRFNGGSMRSTDNFYHLRPETVETFFVLFVMTKDEKYRGWGHDILDALNRHSAVNGWGYAPVKNVNRADAGPDPNGKMQSFLLAETFKYLWLLMSEEPAVDIDKQVFNTEAHPLSVFQPDGT